VYRMFLGRCKKSKKRKNFFPQNLIFQPCGRYCSKNTPNIQSMTVLLSMVSIPLKTEITWSWKIRNLNDHISSVFSFRLQYRQSILSILISNLVNLHLTLNFCSSTTLHFFTCNKFSLAFLKLLLMF